MALTSCTKLVVRGTVGTPNQTWSVGVWFTGGAVLPSLAALQTFVDAAQADTETGLVARFHGVWSQLTTYNGVSAYFYPALPGPASLITLANPAAVVPGNSTSPMPGDIALVASLKTGVAGRSNRGRIYMPFTSATGLDGQGQISQATAQALAGGVADWINALNNDADAGDLGVASVISQTHGYARPINLVTVDSKLDVQRRRQDKNGAEHQGSAGV